MGTVVKNLGPVTAYAYAVLGGYEGTEAEFQELLGNIAIDLSEIENLTVSVTGLPAGSAPTASYADGHLSLGIPKGDKGDKGDQGEQGIRGLTGNGIQSIVKTGTSGNVDTYTITFTDGNTTTFTVTNGIDGEVTEARLAEVLADYAMIDGYYQGMTVGNAEQLVSTVGVEDTAPYNFRTTGGSADVGDRLNEQAVVGVSLPWNQMVRNGDFSDGTNLWNISNASASVTDNILTLTASAYRGFVRQDVTFDSGHRFIFSADIKLTSATDKIRVGLLVNNASLWATGIFTQATTDWQTCASVFTATYTYGNQYVCVRDERSENWDAIQVKNVVLFDLTAMFGTDIADYIYSLEQATAGAGVAWFKKLFPKDYYAYNAVSLQSVKAGAHREIGFNQWDEEWEVGGISNVTGLDVAGTAQIRSKNYTPILPNMQYYFRVGEPGSGANNWQSRFYDADKNYIGTGGTLLYNAVFTPPSNAHYLRFAMQAGYGTTYKNDICINLSWDGERDGEYEAYEEHEYPLDNSVELRGIPKLDSNNQLYYDGDRYLPDGTVERRYGIVDLGSLNWSYFNVEGHYRFAAYPSGIKDFSSNTIANIVCAKYPADTANNVFNNASDKRISCGGGVFLVFDSSYTDAATFKTAMSGVYLVYELATPTTETAEPYQEIQVCNDFGTEEYVDYAVENGDRDVAIPVGHESVYQNNLRAKLEMAPESPEGNGDYIVRQTNGTNEYVPFTVPNELPTSPTTDGSYHLAVTVTNGTPVLSWVADA